MAGRKEYEMLFRLNAQMNGGFNGTFGKAQGEFAKLGKEIQGLSRVQSDISSYQKQQQAIGATESKLENLKTQYSLLQQEIKETEGSTAGLEREKAKLEQRVGDTTSALERQREKLDATNARLKEAGVDTGNLSGRSAELSEKMDELRQKQREAAEGAKNFGESSAQAVGAVQQALAAAGIAAALKEIAAAYMECVRGAAGLEETMSTVEALSGAGAGDMAELNDMAKELGATTKFTATESAEAMTYMAMAGWDASEMLSGMDGVLQLAAASGEDLAQVSDIVTDNLTAFGLTAADTAHFSDVLATAATNSNTNVSIMGETFKMSASIAGALSYSIEDVAVAVGLMANSGVKGSIAGTALKNTFNGLLEGVTLTGAAFGEYKYSAIKADGTMKDFSGTIDELRVYFDQMTEAERVNNAMAIAGARGYNGLLAILNASDEEYASLSASIADCSGAASKMASIKLDNLNGQLTLMNSAWDAVSTTIGEQFNPELRGLAEIGTDVLTGLNEFMKENPAVVKAIMAFIGVMAAATIGMTAYVAVTKVAIPLMNLFAASIPGVNIIMGVTAAVAVITAGIVALTTAANEGVPSVKELTEAARDMNETMEEAGGAYEETAAKTLATASVADNYIDKLEEIEAATDGNVEGNKEYHNILALLCRAIPELADGIDLETDSIEGGTDALRANAQAWEEKAKAQAYQEYMNSLMDQYNGVMVEAAENEIKLTEAQIKAESASDGMNTTYQKLLSALGMTDEQFKKTYHTVSNIPYWAVTGEVASLCGEYRNYEKQMGQAERTQRNLQSAIEKDNGAVSEAESAVNEAQTAYERLTGATEEQAEAEALAAAQSEELQGVLEGVAGQVIDLSDAYDKAYGAALDSIQGQYSLWDEAAAAVSTSAGSINSALESQITYWEDYNTNLETLRERGSDIAGLSDVIASFADGSADSVNAIAGLAGATDDELADMVSNWQKLQEEQDAAAGSVAELKIDFTETMDELQEELATDIEAMDLGDEAAESGKATIQGYINGAADMLPDVRAAYDRLAQAARNALSAAGRNPLDSTRGYAVGTRSAERGFAMVGETGPEMVWFNGGEHVMTASETAAMQRAADVNARNASPAVSAESAVVDTNRAAPFTLQVNLQIQGDATPEVAGELRSFEDDLAERVVEIMEQHGIDTARRAYT